MKSIASIFLLFFCSSLVLSDELISPDIIIKNVDRSMDISSQLVKVVIKINYENAGKTPLSKVLFSVEPVLADRISFVGAASGDVSRTPLRVTPTRVSGRSELFWNIDLKESIQPGKSTTVEVEYIATEALTPYPTTITQKEKQLVKFNGNHHVFLPYPSAKQTTTINVGTRNIESYTKLNPVGVSDTIITYGPYQQVSPFSVDPMVLHYENNSPFLKVAKIERVIEVSHWGNIAIEETIDLVHTGALLKGSFSRYEYQRETHSGMSSIKSFKTILPASASDVYYRDDIGNISTSHMKVLSDSVELDLRPRFPLFGGWKTHYVLGYNVPSYEYLYNSGDNYKLKMRVIDHIYDDMHVEQLVTKVILPEGSEGIDIHPPYPIRHLPFSRHSTYLDTRGRPVLTITKNNLVENHIQDMEVDYNFPRILMLQEPLLIVLALYILFVMVIIYVRLDFSITKDEVSESKMRASGLLDKLLLRQDNRTNTYLEMETQLNKLKTSKDTNTYFNVIKNVNNEHKNETAKIAELLQKVKSDAPEIAEKVAELQKLDKNLKDIYTQKQSLYVDKLVTGKIGRAQFLDAENALNKKRDDLQDKINTILKTLH